MTTCHCGQPLHYSNPETQRYVEALVAQQGPSVPISCEGRTWLVQRHFIALHGIRGSDLPHLGFPEVVHGS